MEFGSNLGLPRGKVELRPYAREWQELYLVEYRLISKRLGDLALDIQHVGSTSVPGCLSKPIMDIAIGVESPAAAMACVERLSQIGYIARGEQGIKGRELLVKGGEERRTHHLQIVEVDSELWNTFVYFRDYLRYHPESVEEYSRLKQDLAARFAAYRVTYTESKGKSIRAIIRRRAEELRGE